MEVESLGRLIIQLVIRLVIQPTTVKQHGII